MCDMRHMTHVTHALSMTIKNERSINVRTSITIIIIHTHGIHAILLLLQIHQMKVDTMYSVYVINFLFYLNDEQYNLQTP